MDAHQPEDQEKRHKELAGKVAEQQDQLESLQATLGEFKIAMDKLQEQVAQLYHKVVATCDACAIDFDVIANHYSIGLFDNIVYVKCPRCNKALPIDSRGGIKKA